MISSHMTPAAMASVHGDADHPELGGTIRFFPCRQGTLVSARIWGLPESGTGFFGFHIHAGGSCRGAGFPGTEGHYDPVGTEHPSHAGDLPPLLGNHGRAHLEVISGRFQVCDIIGRTVVIHSRPDDFKTQPAGDAGAKIACGVIRGM